VNSKIDFSQYIFISGLKFVAITDNRGKNRRAATMGRAHQDQTQKN
jgi:hypothetical protein